MSEAEWEHLADLRQVDFWRQPSEQPSAASVDGAEWIFEGVSWGQRHVVRRWSPREGPAWELGRAMLAVAGIHVSADELY